MNKLFSKVNFEIPKEVQKKYKKMLNINECSEIPVCKALIQETINSQAKELLFRILGTDKKSILLERYLAYQEYNEGLASGNKKYRTVKKAIRNLYGLEQFEFRDILTDVVVSSESIQNNKEGDVEIAKAMGKDWLHFENPTSRKRKKFVRENPLLSVLIEHFTYSVYNGNFKQNMRLISWLRNSTYNNWHFDNYDLSQRFMLGDGLIDFLGIILSAKLLGNITFDEKDLYYMILHRRMLVLLEGMGYKKCKGLRKTVPILLLEN